jgi:small ligand-binding sensory domain FIST
MNRFLHGHATHPDPHMALALAAAQIEAQRLEPGHVRAPTLGWVYMTDDAAVHADALLRELQQRWPGVDWVGASGVGIAANGVEYFGEPAVSLMLTDLPRAQYQVFSGARPLGAFAAHTAQVHADPGTADLAELIHDMAARTATGYLFGGLASGAARTVHIAGSVLAGGLSGVAFGAEVALVSRVTQGCQPAGRLRRITAAERNVITALDGEPALDCLLRDAGVEGAEPRAALPRLRQFLVGLVDAPASAMADAPAGPARGHQFERRGAFGAETRVRNLIGLDAGRRGIAIADAAEVGMQLAFCTRSVDAARRDLVRICAEVRDEVEPETWPHADALAQRAGAPDAPDAPGLAAAGETTSAAGAATASAIAGAVYISCAGRGGAHFGGLSAELEIVRHALGDVPLVGFFGAGEIAHANLYGYTGVLTVFRA